MTTESRTIPFRALGGLFEADDAAAATSVIEGVAAGGSFFPLPEEKQFQDAFALSEGASSAIPVNSCGTALDLCMMVLDVGPGDEVIVPPLTFICTATCASARRAKVVFADIDPATLCLDPRAVREKITPRTKAILPVHFGGQPCDLDGFDALSGDTGIPVIYDAAHAAGARARGRGIGGRGWASCYSFQSNKNMTTLGEGGAITTNDAGIAEQIRQKKTFGFVYGASPRVVTVGFNYRLTKPQLACGLTQLAKLQRVIALRLERFRRINQLLADVDELLLPAPFEEGHACHLYALRVNTAKINISRENLLSELNTRCGVQTVIHYPAVYDWEVFNNLPHDRSGCPVADLACRTIFSLPIFPETSWEDLEYIADSIKDTLGRLVRRSTSGA